MSKKQFPFSTADVLEEMRGIKKLSVDYSEWKRGSGRDAVHSSYVVNLGWTEFDDGGKYKSFKQFVSAAQDIFKNIADELSKEHIILVRSSMKIDSGRTDYFNIPIYDDVECVSSLVKIVPCKSFMELQEWLSKKAQFKLGVTDLYVCSICQKRSSKSLSGFEYTAENEQERSRIRILLAELKSVYKQGNKVVCSIDVKDEMDSNNDDMYEYEQYGTRYSQLSITISTPSGRNPKTFKL